MFIDYHLHTNFSADSTYDMEEEILHAIEIGLEEICFCEHVDYEVSNLTFDYEEYNQMFLNMKEKYKDKIILKKGIEFGIQQHTVKKFQDAYDQNNFDFVILSCHQVNNEEFWTQEFQIGKTQDEIHKLYYNEIFHVIKKYNDYSVLGHLDLIRRYDKEGNYDFSNIKDIVTKILKHIIAHDKGLEVNTSSYRYGIDDLTPSREILQLYKDLGGSIITIGSDAHKKEHLGDQIKETMKELKEMGFETIATYDNMVPTFHKL